MQSKSVSESSRKKSPTHESPEAPGVPLSLPNSRSDSPSDPLQSSPTPPTNLFTQYHASFVQSKPLKPFQILFPFPRAIVPPKICKPSENKFPILDPDPKISLPFDLDHDVPDLTHHEGLHLLEDHFPSFHDHFEFEKSDLTPAEVTNPDPKPEDPSPSDTDLAPCCCSKSECLQRYCKCFLEQRFCTSKCQCKNCRNLEVNQDMIVLLRQELTNKNPRAFSSKIAKIATQTTPLCTHGCKCQKTVCNKKYCECFNANIPCSQLCKCIVCKNNKVVMTDSDKLKLKNSVKKPSLKKTSTVNKVVNKVKLYQSFQNLQPGFAQKDFEE